MTHMLSRIEYDESTGIPFIIDNRGDWHIVPWNMASGNDPRVYIQTILTNKELWPNITEFHSIKNSFTGNNKLEYTVPEDKSFHIPVIVAAQSYFVRQQDKFYEQGISIIGLYIDGSYRVGIPILDSLHYHLYEPIHLPSNTHIEVKFKPFHRRVHLSLVLGGFLLDINNG